MRYVFLLFILMPILEIAVLIQVGGAIGGFTTIAIVILTAILGTAMLRQQGLATLANAQQRMGRGEMPAQQLLEGVILLIGGVLLLTPGFITDAFGFACLIPASRGWMANRLASRSLTGANIFVGGAASGGFRTGGIGSAESTRNGPAPAGSGRSAGADEQAGGVPLGSSGTPASGEPVTNRRKPSSAKRTDGNVIDGDYQQID